MKKAKLFENGRSQAVRLPKEYRFEGDEVYINKVGNTVVLMPVNDKWSDLWNALEMVSDDFMEDGRNQGVDQEREPLDL